METCYRHSSRETRVSCSNCGRPICTDCMTTTPVGMRCPECARQRTPVRTMRNVVSGGIEATRALIAINCVVFLASGHFTLSGPTGGKVIQNGVLSAETIAVSHQYWRLVTAGFLHENLLHIGFNMYLLYVLGQMLEPALGKVKFVAIYTVALLFGSAGAMVGVSQYSASLGASGAVFGLAGAAIVEMRARGINPMDSGIPALILINLVLGVALPNISIGDHIGGLIGGGLAALALGLGDRRRSPLLGLAGCVVLGVVAVGVAIAVAHAQVPAAAAGFSFGP
ncbi:MAG TPA: rhomboid family intramembrane serine protease [Solirubrobacteraceae bacterium]|jgi:membrane associated rhomboid family serine protease|nr:rhomboid family intramembrane serine protease [Solirubrobacteraceae bacterium]